ncbi:MAG: ATP-binding protein [Acidobacteria bacterium]|nr:ATP-binding protein [Acidobacteriota bacterium]
MSFRTRLLIFFALTVTLAVVLVSWAVASYSRREFETLDQQRTEALVAQFRREFASRGEEVVRRVEGIVEAEANVRMAIDLARPQADASLYVNDARGLSATHHLDFLEIVSNDGKLISSAQWPARFGYPNEWVGQQADWKGIGAFLRREELPDGVALALTAVRAVRVGEKNLYFIGGQRLDKDFLGTLVLPTGTRALLYQDLEASFVPGALTDASGPLPAAQTGRLVAFIDQVRRDPRPLAQTVQLTSDAASTETFHALPLLGRDAKLLGILIVGSSRRDLVLLTRFIRDVALMVGGVGVLLALATAWWFSRRITRPVESLAAGALEVAAGRWDTRVAVRSKDEIGQLANAFNTMTRQLAEQKERLVAAERVAAWRELARRLAHELKNPLFPLQLTVENLQRAREQTSEQFDEIFFESTGTLRAELEKLNSIVGRFSEFAKMPVPQLQPVLLNEAVRRAIKLFEGQFNGVGRPPIVPELYFDESVGTVQADPDLLHRALQNLVLNAIDAMPAGGTLTIRTQARDGSVRMEVSDTGGGLTREECERLFTPYYTTKQHGTGLGLAIVQSVVSDHQGRISVESEPGRGTTFRIELPVQPPPSDRETREQP